MSENYMTPMHYIRVRVFCIATQQQFADLLGYQQPVICRLETGVRKPSFRTMGRIREVAAARGIKWRDSWFFEVPKRAA